jgi:hypothetical protein
MLPFEPLLAIESNVRGTIHSDEKIGLASGALLYSLFFVLVFPVDMPQPIGTQLHRTASRESFVFSAIGSYEYHTILCRTPQVTYRYRRQLLHYELWCSLDRLAIDYK